jgi:hypothetical protein
LPANNGGRQRRRRASAPTQCTPSGGMASFDHSLRRPSPIYALGLGPPRFARAAAPPSSSYLCLAAASLSRTRSGEFSQHQTPLSVELPFASRFWDPAYFAGGGAGLCARAAALLSGFSAADVSRRALPLVGAWRCHSLTTRPVGCPSRRIYARWQTRLSMALLPASRFIDPEVWVCGVTTSLLVGPWPAQPAHPLRVRRAPPRGLLALQLLPDVRQVVLRLVLRWLCHAVGSGPLWPEAGLVTAQLHRAVPAVARGDERPGVQRAPAGSDAILDGRRRGGRLGLLPDGGMARHV